MESQVNFYSLQNIFGTSQQSSVAKFTYKPEAAWDSMKMASYSSSSIQVYVNPEIQNQFENMLLTRPKAICDFRASADLDDGLCETSPRLLQRIRRMFQHGFVWKLHKCFVDCRRGDE